jgi:hypothetical protein
MFAMGNSADEARFGWGSDFPEFKGTPAAVIVSHLGRFLQDVSESQTLAWEDYVPKLQHEVDEVLQEDSDANRYWAILEYELPMESRRPDCILLAKGAVLVLELKGKARPSQADIDQAAAYARDLRCYHESCAGRIVMPIVVPSRAKGYIGEYNGVHIAGPDALDAMIRELEQSPDTKPLSPREFLTESSYRPLPTLIQAARELFENRTIRRIHRAWAATEPAVTEITRVIHEAAATNGRRLILLTGVPGSGKTLVGLTVAHSPFLDDLAIPRGAGKPTAPAVFLSGNGPLVEVLQYELREAGGGGKAFVRGVRDYVKRYSSSSTLVPPEHVLIFDEAQRAFDAEQLQETHRRNANFTPGKSEPEQFIEFAERIPGWCAVIGLVGEGQEIHIGEEAGLIQWRHAVEGSGCPESWQVHCPPAASHLFEGCSVPAKVSPALNLDTELRFHRVSDLHVFVESVLENRDVGEIKSIADELVQQGYNLWISRSLGDAKQYLSERYCEEPERRYGLLASARDKDLSDFGIPNDYQSTKQVRYGPWYGDAEDAPGGRSCRLLQQAVTEFGAQGLELDAALLAWGTDLIIEDGKWSNRKAKRYQRQWQVKDAYQLRLNAYRVLMTRARDAMVLFVPPLKELDETYQYLNHCGFEELKLGDNIVIPSGIFSRMRRDPGESPRQVV